ncbi:metal transporter [Paenibacillus yonginensis]|uniref:Magnesium transport protein CorA n=1 Tax=Paenibacillus yonginensis TaxID=1462996 RepID=A0A1B1MVI7_9BACL|nr:magnesium/cobalt transporter CorA [Paenibacillus yonginensis]ANS73193.1 metal transporter [Paenibacillus yonginensis]
MIRTLSILPNNEIVEGSSLDRLDLEASEWIWVDFDRPADEECVLLDSYFHFHPLAIEDCVLHNLQRPKLDVYEDVRFYVLHAIDPVSLKAREVNLFVGEKLIVSFHKHQLEEVEQAWEQMTGWIKGGRDLRQGPMAAAYAVIDHLVDSYFPSLYSIEDELADIESLGDKESVEQLMNQVFDLRGRLLKLRRSVVPMRDLLYRIINSQHLKEYGMHRAYFADIYDHLLKLSDMIEADREMTADLRDSYISLNSNRMNGIMKTLTVITTIFMPLTLIAGIYGMNFDHMPELHYVYGYFTVLLFMAGLSLWMVLWFNRRGWFK